MQGVACLVIDLQDCFLKAIPGRELLEKRTKFVLEACNLLGIKTYFTEQIPEKLGETNAQIKSLAPDSPTFSKRTFSAWQITELQDLLTSDEISHLLIAGIETPICVYQTAIQARSDDMAVTLLSDCIGCRRQEDAGPVIQTLLNHQTLLLPSESVFYSILGDIDHPKFKAFTQLVKTYNS